MAFSFTQTSITARIVVVAVSNRDLDNVTNFKWKIRLYRYTINPTNRFTIILLCRFTIILLCRFTIILLYRYLILRFRFRFLVMLEIEEVLRLLVVLVVATNRFDT